MVGTKTAINVDGLDWEREKWPPLAKKYLRFAEFLSTNMPNSYITDSGAVQAYYRERFGGNPIYIAYGSEVEHVEPGETLARFGLEPGKYVLFVGRLVPENCVHHLVQAFRQLRTNLNCVIVGDASYAESYKKSLLEQAKEDPRIIFTGYVFGNGYRELGSNAHIFVEPSAVGGTHPALLEAMAFGNCVVVNDSKGNLETIEAAGFSYDGQDGPESLKAILDQLLSDPELVNSYRTRARQRAASTFSWDSVTDDYERLFYKLLEEPAPARLQ
jgi:glycosyltransferase involved in cell wall biosynthesis